MAVSGAMTLRGDSCRAAKGFGASELDDALPLPLASLAFVARNEGLSGGAIVEAGLEAESALGLLRPTALPFREDSPVDLGAGALTDAGSKTLDNSATDIFLFLGTEGAG